jgi:hypothetical protein
LGPQNLDGQIIFKTNIAVKVHFKAGSSKHTILPFDTCLTLPLGSSSTAPSLVKTIGDERFRP